MHLYSKTAKTSLTREGVSGTEGDSGMKTLEGGEDVEVASLTGELSRGRSEGAQQIDPPLGFEAGVRGVWTALTCEC